MKITGNMPINEGTSHAKELGFDTKQRLIADKVSKAATLKDLENDLIFFTHAAFIVFGKLHFDPVAAYVQQTRGAISPFRIQSDGFPIFSGLGEEWDRQLIGIQKEEWERLVRYLDALSIVYKKKKIFFRALRQKIPIVDIFSISKHSVLPDPIPMIDIFTYGLDGNTCCIHFKPALTPLELPQVVIDEPFPETIRLADNIFNNEKKPYSTISGE